MKKYFLRMLFLMCICFLIGCTTEGTTEISNYTTTPLTSTSDTKDSYPYVTQSEAERAARQYVSTNKSQLASRAGVSSIKYMEIASITSRSVGNGYSVTVNGNFFGYDAYGVLVDQYTFSWDLTAVSSSGYSVRINSRGLFVSG